MIRDKKNDIKLFFTLFVVIFFTFASEAGAVNSSDFSRSIKASRHLQHLLDKGSDSLSYASTMHQHLAHNLLLPVCGAFKTGNNTNLQYSFWPDRLDITRDLKNQLNRFSQDKNTEYSAIPETRFKFNQQAISGGKFRRHRLSSFVPYDFYYVHANHIESLNNLLRLDSSFFAELLRGYSRSYQSKQIVERYLNRFGLSRNMPGTLFNDENVSHLAITGSDMLFDWGSDLTILMIPALDKKRLFNDLRKSINHYSKARGASEQRLKIENQVVYFISNKHRPQYFPIHSLLTMFDDGTIALSNSKAALKRIIRARKGRVLPLDRSIEFLKVRSLLEASDKKSKVFFYIPGPFIDSMLSKELWFKQFARERELVKLTAADHLLLLYRHLYGEQPLQKQQILYWARSETRRLKQFAKDINNIKDSKFYPLLKQAQQISIEKQWKRPSRANFQRVATLLLRQQVEKSDAKDKAAAFKKEYTALTRYLKQYDILHRRFFNTFAWAAHDLIPVLGNEAFYFSPDLLSGLRYEPSAARMQSEAYSDIRFLTPLIDTELTASDTTSAEAKRYREITATITQLLSLFSFEPVFQLDVEDYKIEMITNFKLSKPHKNSNREHKPPASEVNAPGLEIQDELFVFRTDNLPVFENNTFLSNPAMARCLQHDLVQRHFTGYSVVETGLSESAQSSKLPENTVQKIYTQFGKLTLNRNGSQNHHDNENLNRLPLDLLFECRRSLFFSKENKALKLFNQFIEQKSRMLNAKQNIIFNKIDKNGYPAVFFANLNNRGFYENEIYVLYTDNAIHLSRSESKINLIARAYQHKKQVNQQTEERATTGWATHNCSFSFQMGFYSPALKLTNRNSIFLKNYTRQVKYAMQDAFQDVLMYHYSFYTPFNHTGFYQRFGYLPRVTTGGNFEPVSKNSYRHRFLTPARAFSEEKASAFLLQTTNRRYSQQLSVANVCKDETELTKILIE